MARESAGSIFGVAALLCLGLEALLGFTRIGRLP